MKTSITCAICGDPMAKGDYHEYNGEFICGYCHQAINESFYNDKGQTFKEELMEKYPDLSIAILRPWW